MIDDDWWLVIDTQHRAAWIHLSPSESSIRVLKQVDVANFKDWNFHLRNNFPTEMFNKGNV